MHLSTPEGFISYQCTESNNSIQQLNTRGGRLLYISGENNLRHVIVNKV